MIPSNISLIHCRSLSSILFHMLQLILTSNRETRHMLPVLKYTGDVKFSCWLVLVRLDSVLTRDGLLWESGARWSRCVEKVGRVRG